MSSHFLSEECAVVEQHPDIDVSDFVIDREAGLEHDLSRQSELVWKYAHLLANAETDEIRSLSALNRTYALLYNQYKASKKGRVTENEIKQAVLVNEDYIKYENRYNEAKSMRKKYQAALKAIEEKGRMLVQLSANTRKEREHVQ